MSAVPDLVSLHNTLFVALQAGSQTLFIETHSLLILQMKPAKTIQVHTAGKSSPNVFFWFLCTYENHI